MEQYSYSVEDAGCHEEVFLSLKYVKGFNENKIHLTFTFMIMGLNSTHGYMLDPKRVCLDMTICIKIDIKHGQMLTSTNLNNLVYLLFSPKICISVYQCGHNDFYLEYLEIKLY